MHPAEYLTQGFLLGLALSPTCLGVCVPILVPFFGAKKRSRSELGLTFIWFLVGRLLGYLLMGGLAGWIGMQIVNQSELAKQIGQITYLGLGGLLLLYAVMTSFPHWSFCQSLLRRWPQGSTPLGMGFLTGVNICPPFMAALLNAGQSGSPVAGMYLLLAFFGGTTLILLPLPMVGILAKEEVMQVMGRVAAGLVGVWMLAKGIGILS